MLTTTWHPGDDGPGGFYRALGFRKTGELSGEQTVGELDLTRPVARAVATMWRRELSPSAAVPSPAA